MADISATFAPNRCFLANTGGTSIPIGCCENRGDVRRRERRDIRDRARDTPGAGPASCTCCFRHDLSSAAKCGRCGRRRRR